MNKGHDSRAIANKFVQLAQRAGDRLTIMPLVKYVYLAHGWTLGYTGEPLICHEVQAWKFGPVVPKVYNAFYTQGFIVSEEARGMLGLAGAYHADVSEVQEEVINQIYEKYSVLRPFQLSALTHAKGSPWSKYRYRRYHTIPQDEIREYYEKRVAEQQKKHESES